MQLGCAVLVCFRVSHNRFGCTLRIHAHCAHTRGCNLDPLLNTLAHPLMIVGVCCIACLICRYYWQSTRAFRVRPCGRLAHTDARVHRGTCARTCQGGANPHTPIARPDVCMIHTAYATQLQHLTCVLLGTKVLPLKCTVHFILA